MVRRSGWCGNRQDCPRGPLVGAGTDRDGLVASAGRRARLLPRRMGGRHAGLGLSRPAQRSLVSCTAFSTDVSCPNCHSPNSYVPAPLGTCPSAATPPVRYVELHCKTNFSFLEGASHPRRAGRPGGQAGLCRNGRHRSEQSGRRGPRPRRSQGGRPQTGVGAEVTTGRCQPGFALGDESSWLWPALSALDPRPSSGPQRRMSPRLRRCRRARQRFARRRVTTCWKAELTTGTSRDGAKSFLIEPTPSPSCIAAWAMDGDWSEWQRGATAVTVPLIAAGDVHYHDASRRYLQDVLTAIRLKTTVAELGAARFPNGERRLRALDEILSLFAQCPAAVSLTAEVADRCTFSLDELRYEYPEELCPAGETPSSYLARLTWAGAQERYPAGVPTKVSRADRARAGHHRGAELRGLFPDRLGPGPLCPRPRRSSARDAARRPTRPSATAWGSRPLIPIGSMSCSSGSFPRIGTKPRTSTSTSSISGEKK